MPHHPKTRVFASIALSAVLLASALATTVFARTNGTTKSATVGTTSAKHVQVQVGNVHLVDMSKVPQATPAQLAQRAGPVPYLTPIGAKAYQQAQRTNRGAAAPHGAGYTPITSSSRAVSPELPSTFNKWQGQSDGPSTCPYFGSCQPPDMGIAAAPTGMVIQSVNTSLALYSINGSLQPGWPKQASAFFGVQAPQPANCDSAHNNIPFMGDPRSWYDPSNYRWGEAALQVEGWTAQGIAPSCTFVAKYWIAVSLSPDPNGTWRVFSLTMNLSATGADPNGVADFTQFGVNGDGVYVSSNIFNKDTNAFDYAEIIGCGKAGLYGSVSFTCSSWFGLSATIGSTTVLVDTVNPAQETMETDNAPHAEFFVNSFNFSDVYGDSCTSTSRSCHGAVIWSLSDPGFQSGSGGDQLNGVIVDTNSYDLPPFADEPTQTTTLGTIGCTGGNGCIKTGDNRVSATPVYHAGHLFAAHETGWINASSQFVCAIQWWDFTVSLNPGYPTKISGASEAQDGYIAASSNYTSLMYPVMYPDLDNDIIMGYDYMGDTIFPSINITSRRVTDPASVMTGGLGIIAVPGTNSYAADSLSPGRWGDYEAMSYVAPWQDFIWFSSEYANSSNDWTTAVMRLKLNMRD